VVGSRFRRHLKDLGEIDSMINPYEIGGAFASDFRAMEYAMKRSGFLRKNMAVAEADWDLFAQSLGAAFYDQVVEQAIAAQLIGVPPRRLMANMQWSPQITIPLTNVAQLIINGVRRVRNSYFHGEKFTGGPEGQWVRDVALVAEAHAVLKLAMIFASNTFATSQV